MTKTHAKDAPILVTGAAGHVGANLTHVEPLQRHRHRAALISAVAVTGDTVAVE